MYRHSAKYHFRAISDTFIDILSIARDHVYKLLIDMPDRLISVGIALHGDTDSIKLFTLIFEYSFDSYHREIKFSFFASSRIRGYFFYPFCINELKIPACPQDYQDRFIIISLISFRIVQQNHVA